MKKTLVSLLIAGATAMASANASNTVEFVYYYGPGGGTDQQTSALIPSLKQEGVVTKKTFLKSCAEAVNYIKNNRNAFLVSITGDFAEADSNRCPGRDSVAGANLFSTVGDTPFMFCVSPHNNTLTLDDLAKSETDRPTALITSDISWFLFDHFMKTAKQPLNLKIVPYKGAADTRTAVLSGNVDVFYAGGPSVGLAQQGATCLASSSTTNWAGVPSLAELSTDTDFPDVSMSTELWYVGEVDDDVRNAITRAMANDNFKDRLHKLNVSHSGVGIGVSSSDQLKSMKEINDLIADLKSQTK